MKFSLLFILLICSLILNTATAQTLPSGSSVRAVVSSPDSLRIFALGKAAGTTTGYSQAYVDSVAAARYALGLADGKAIGLATMWDSLVVSNGRGQTKTYIPKP